MKESCCTCHLLYLTFMREQTGKLGVTSIIISPLAEVLASECPVEINPASPIPTLGHEVQTYFTLCCSDLTSERVRYFTSDTVGT